jgi:Fe-Mn family superoxide dismutase
MNRRAFLASSGAALLGSSPLLAGPKTPIAQGVPLGHEPLPYAFDALEPYIDAATMNVHYAKHHAGYLTNLRTALKESKLTCANVAALISGLNTPPATVTPALQEALRNHGGGHVNHTLFWRSMTPPGTGEKTPGGPLAAAIQSAFGGLDEFKKGFAEAAAKRFGSGWAWLVLRDDGKMIITSTPNQDNPLMAGFVPEAERGYPVLGLDVWEHAYYLKYQNKRTDYITAWWNVVNWAQVERRYAIVTA